MLAIVPTEKLSRLRMLSALLLGMAVTFTLHGYSYGRSNQSVYLLDALRRAHLNLLVNDWFTTQTLQYHWAFSLLAAGLMRLHVIEPAFLLIYVALIGLFHFAWYRIVQFLGGGVAAFLIAVALSALAAGDTGLGMYQFFQDGSLLPSNISNVMLLSGIAAWVERRFLMAGICFGIAGVFHLNHALVGSLLWVAFCLSLYAGKGLGRNNVNLDGKGKRGPSPMPSPRVQGEGGVFLVSTGAALVPSAINVAIAARAKLSRSGGLPLSEFVDLYVRLRHPHHYQPSSWPIGIWVCFVVLTSVALVRLRGLLRHVVLWFCGLIAIALLGAGLSWVSETLVQLSLYRFSIYVELLGCSAAAVVLARHAMIRGVATIVLASIVILCLWRGPYAGAFQLPKDDADYVRLCEWISRHTPSDAVLIVPPDEESMRLIGQRAIVVNFKAVPQLSAELIEWRQRLCDVLDLPDLHAVPHFYTQTLAALRQRYDALGVDERIAVAKKYRAGFIVTSHDVPALDSTRVTTGLTSHYALYAISRE